MHKGKVIRPRSVPHKDNVIVTHPHCQQIFNYSKNYQKDMVPLFPWPYHVSVSLHQAQGSLGPLGIASFDFRHRSSLLWMGHYKKRREREGREGEKERRGEGREGGKEWKGEQLLPTVNLTVWDRKTEKRNTEMGKMRKRKILYFLKLSVSYFTSSWN